LSLFIHGLKAVAIEYSHGLILYATVRSILDFYIYYHMVKNKEAFNISAVKIYQQKYKEKKINQLKKRIAILEAA
jgi:hypothetical protein